MDLIPADEDLVPVGAQAPDALADEDLVPVPTNTNLGPVYDRPPGIAEDPESVTRGLTRALEETGSIPPELEPTESQQAAADNDPRAAADRRFAWEADLENRRTELNREKAVVARGGFAEDRAQADKETRLQAVFEASQKKEPARLADELKIARDTGVPAYVVAARYDDFKAMWKGQQFDWHRWKGDNPDAAKLALENEQLGALVLRDEPISILAKGLRSIYRLEQYDEKQRRETRAAMREDRPANPVRRPDFYNSPDVRMATDPTATQGSFAKIAAEYEKTSKGVERSKLGFSLFNNMLLGGDTAELQAKISELDKDLQPTWKDPSPLEQVGLDAAGIAPSIIETMKTGGLVGAAGAAVGAGVGYYLGGRKGAVELGTKGFALGARVGSAGSSVRLETGSALLDLLQEKTDDGKPIDRNIALGAAAAYGIAAGGIEAISFGHEASAFGPLGDAIREGRGKAFLKGMLKDASAKRLFKDVALRLAKGAAAEAGEEVSQQASQDVISYVAASLTDKKLQKPNVEGAITRLGDVAQSTFLGSLGVAPGAAGVNVATQLSGERVARQLGQLVRHEEAQAGGAQVKAILGLKDSPTAIAAPAAVAKMVHDITADTGAPVTHLYVPAADFVRFFQDRNEDPAAAAGHLLGEEGPRVLQEAVATGDGRIAVPLAQYLEKWGNTEVATALAESTTTQPHHPTAKQLQDIEPKAKELAAAYEKENAPPSSEAEQKWVAAMEQNLATKENYDAKKAKTSMALWRALIRTQSEVFGEDPEQVFRDQTVELQEGDNARSAPAGALAQSPLPPSTSLSLSERLPGLEPEQRARELYTDPVSGLMNRAGWEASPRPKGKLVAIITATDAKAFNDDPSGGHDTTNALLRTIGASVAGIDSGAARQGTNFLLHVGSEQELQEAIARIKQTLPDQRLSLEGAVGYDLDKTFAKLDKSVAAKREAKALPARGGTAVDLGTLPALEQRFAKEPAQLAVAPHLVEKAGMLSDAEHFREAYQDKAVPEILSGTGWAAIPRKAFVASLDLKGLKAINERLGQAAGDQVLAHFGRVAKSMGGGAFDFAHLSGDEYAAQSDNQAELQSFLGDLRAQLLSERAHVTLGGRTYIAQVEFRDGIGEKSYGAADRVLNAAKRAEQAGSGQPGRALRSDGQGSDAQSGARGTEAQRRALLEERRSRAERRGTGPQAFVDRQAEGPGRGPELGGVEEGDTSFDPAKLSEPAYSPESLAAVEALVARMRSPERKAQAQAWLDFVTEKTTERPQVSPAIEKTFATYGLVDPVNGYTFSETGQSLERSIGSRKKQGNEPEELRRIRFSNMETGFSDMSGVGQKKTRYEQLGPAAGPRGYTDIPSRDGLRRVFKIALNKNADLSTFLHESAHVYLELFGDLAARADAPERVKNDWSSTLKWMGLADGKDIKVEHHEKWARTFEAYLMTGKAPSSKLEGAFQAFKLWLKNIYRTFTSLNADLSPEISGVFDRLLATDAEIEATKRKMGLNPMLTAVDFVDPAQYRSYLEDVEQATSHASMAAELRALKDKLREQESWWKEEEAKHREDAAADYEQMPAVRANEYTQRGVLTWRSDEGVTRETDFGGRPTFNRAAVEEAVGKEAAKRFLLSKEGAHPDEAAEMFGYPTGKAMLEGILARPEKGAWVNEAAAERMRTAHPDILDEKDKLQELVAKGLHGEFTAKWLLHEWDNLQKKAGVPGTPLEAVKQAAKQIAAGRSVGKLGVGNTLTAERRAASNAAKASTKGDYAQAAAFKQQQLLNLFLHRELSAARDERESFLELAGKLSQDKARARLGKAGPVYRGGVDFILESLQLKEPAAPGEVSTSIAEVVGAMEGNGATILFDVDALEQVLSSKGEWKQLTVEEMRMAHAALKNIQGAASTKATVLLDGKRVDRAQIVADAVAEARKNESDKSWLEASSESAKSFTQWLGGKWNAFSGANLQLGTMIKWLGGGDLNSTWVKAFFKPMQDAKAREVDLLNQTVKPVIDAFHALPAEALKHFQDRVDGEALFPGHRKDVPAPSRRYELLVMALNSGNESNLQRLLEGRGITMPQLTTALDSLTKEELGWVQSVWDANEALWPAAAKMEEGLSGLPPEKLQLRELRTKHGVLKGGYFPAIYDRRYEAVGEKQVGESIASLMDPTYTRPGTSHSYLKSRAQNFSGAISLEPGSIPGNLAKVAHDIAFREAVMSVGSLVMDPEIKAVLRERLGDGRARQFLTWVKDTGQMRGVQDMDHAGEMLKLVRTLKGNTVIAALGYSVPNMIEDASNLPAAVFRTDLKARNLMVGLSQLIGSNGAAAQMAHEKSGELRTRRGQLHRELTRQVKQLTAKGVFVTGPLEAVKHHAFALMEASDWATSTPIWLGAYRQAQEAGLNEADAVAKADDTVRKVFPSHSPVDLAGILRDKGFIGTSLQFYGFLNVVYNGIADLTHQAVRADGVVERAKKGGNLLGYVAAVGVIGALLRGQGRRDDEDWDTWAMRTMMLTPITALPFGGDAANGIEAAATGRPQNQRNSSLVGVGAGVGAAVSKLLADDDKDTDKKVAALLRSIAPLTGLPTSQTLRSAQYLWDLWDGDLEANEPLDVPKGLIYGERVAK